MVKGAAYPMHAPLSTSSAGMHINLAHQRQDMTSLIIHISVRHGNTDRVSNAMANTLDASLLPVKQATDCGSGFSDSRESWLHQASSSN
jgi:hypothetical protein